MGDRLVGGCLELLARVARDLAQGPVDAQEAPIGGSHGHADRRLVEGRAEAVLGLSQRVLGAAALRDVLDLRDEVERLPGVVAHERDRQQHPALRAVRADVALFHAVAAPLAGDHLTHELEVGLEVVRVRDVLEGQLQQLSGLVPDDLGEGAVDAQEGAVESDQRHADRGLLEGVGEALLGLLERAVHGRADDGVRARAHVAGDLAALVAQLHRPAPDPDDRAVRSYVAVLQAEGPILGLAAKPFARNPVDVLRVNDERPPLADGAFGVHAGQLGPALVHEDKARVGVQLVDADRQFLGQDVEVLARRQQRRQPAPGLGKLIHPHLDRQNGPGLSPLTQFDRLLEHDFALQRPVDRAFGGDLHEPVALL